MDFKKMGAELGLDEEEFLELVELFIETSVADIDKLQVAHENQDAAGIREAAHSIKGAAANLGFMELSAEMETVENNARSNNLNNLEDVISSLKNQLGQMGNRL